MDIKNTSHDGFTESKTGFLIYAYLEEIGAIPDLLRPGLKGASPNSTEWLDDDYCNVIRRAYFNENIRSGKQGEVLL